MPTAVVLTVPGALESIVVRIECAADAPGVDVTRIGVIPGPRHVTVTVAAAFAAIDEPEYLDGDLRGWSTTGWDTAGDPFDDEPPAIPW